MTKIIKNSIKYLIIFTLTVYGMASDFPANFTAGNPLTATQLNQWKQNRSGNLLPISPSTNNYADSTHNIGSTTYRWNIGYINNIYASALSGKVLNVGDGSESSFTATASSTLQGEHCYTDFSIPANTTLNIGAAGWLIVRVSGTFSLTGIINGKGKGGAGNSGAGNGTDGGFIGGPGGAANNGALGGVQKSYYGTLWAGIAPIGSGTVQANNLLAYHREFPSYGAGGAGWDGAPFGNGGGGNGGGGMIVIAKSVVISGTPTIDMRGEDGTGGGGGGGGGVFMLKWATKSGTIPTPLVSAGSSAVSAGWDGWYKID